MKFWSMIIKADKIIVFDLDDTLYKEIEFLKSAYAEIAVYIAMEVGLDKEVVLVELINFYRQGSNVFEEIIKKYRLTQNIEYFLDLYRRHVPQIQLTDDTLKVLKSLKSQNHVLGLLTDGRSSQQRNKIRSLGITDYFDAIVISQEIGSEKPDKANYIHFENQFGSGNYFYIADNMNKDFITPNKLGWTTIGLLDNGQNIHKQNLELPLDYHPKFWLNYVNELVHLMS